MRGECMINMRKWMRVVILFTTLVVGACVPLSEDIQPPPGSEVQVPVVMVRTRIYAAVLAGLIVWIGLQIGASFWVVRRLAGAMDVLMKESVFNQMKSFLDILQWEIILNHFLG